MCLVRVLPGVSLAVTWYSGQRACRGRDRRRQFADTAQVAVDGSGGAAPLGDGPDDQRLAAAHVPGHENPGHRGGVRAVPGDVAPLVEIDAEAGEQPGSF